VFQHVLLPTDGSTASLQATDVLARLAAPDRPLQVTIAVVVVPLSPTDSDFRTEFLAEHNAGLRRHGQLAADRAVEHLRASGAVCTTKVLEGKPVSAVLAREAETGGYDLIVMSSRGLGQQQDRLRYLGSVTEHVIRRASVPVLVVPVKDDEE